MSATGETLTLMMEDRVTFPQAPTASAQSSAKGRRVVTVNTKQPSEASNTYFPDSTPSPTSSSSSEAEDDTPSPVTRAVSQMIGASYPIPPLEREYMPPTEELDVARQLAMKPLPRSLHCSLQRAATATKKPIVEDEETRARKLADAKRELLALAGQI
ncbi:hypothetical protein F5Y04DRAFT_275699 [Hypomontagnella monticulosa]|nr:hypothetical protein F5Y04DRAFT_275699 [Hypomontagnella monticulosa]